MTCLGYPGEIGNKTVPEQDLSASLPRQTLQVDIDHDTVCSAGKLNIEECVKVLATEEDYQQYVQGSIATRQEKGLIQHPIFGCPTMLLFEESLQ